MRAQVVHGCRQLVSWDVGLSPATSETLVASWLPVRFLACWSTLQKTRRQEAYLYPTPLWWSAGWFWSFFVFCVKRSNRLKTRLLVGERHKDKESYNLEAYYTLARLPVRKLEEGEDDVKSACPLCPGLHTCYNGRDNELQSRES